VQATWARAQVQFLPLCGQASSICWGWAHMQRLVHASSRGYPYQSTHHTHSSKCYAACTARLCCSCTVQSGAAALRFKPSPSQVFFHPGAVCCAAVLHSRQPRCHQANPAVPKKLLEPRPAVIRAQGDPSRSRGYSPWSFTVCLSLLGPPAGLPAGW
jgi:hypothetical protein